MTFQMMPGICEDIITDEEWLWQMLLNLLTNACKYTDRGSILLLVSVKQATGASSDSPTVNSPLLSLASKLLFEVYDTG